MIVKDKTYLNGFNQVKLPKLKGKVKITLHNCRTGKNEVSEGENIITNAVADILANNYLGTIDTSKLLPLYSSWYGGILAYKEPHTDTTDPTDYYMKGNSVNEVTAHAGDTAPSTAEIIAEDLKRGSPLSVTQTENSVTRVWEWGSSQGNGQISALSLCHNDIGNAGTGSTSSAFQALQPFATIQGSNLNNVTIGTKTKDNVFCQYDENHSLYFHQGEDSDYYSDLREGGTNHVHFASDKLTLHIRRLPFERVGLFETLATSSTEKVVTITLPFTIYTIPAYYFDYANKRLWIFSNMTGLRAISDTTVNYAVIDCESETVLTSGTIVSDTAELTAVCCCNNNKTVRKGSEYDFAQIIKDGNYVYLPTGTVTWGDDDSSGAWYSCYVTVTGFKKINISNQSEQSKITYNSSQQTFRPIVKAGGLLISSGVVVNGGVGYSCVDQFDNPNLDALSYIGWIFAEPNRVSSYVSAKGSGFTSSTRSRYIVANKFVNTSIYNLNSAVQKTTAKSMQIEYKLEEVSGNE